VGHLSKEAATAWRVCHELISYGKTAGYRMLWHVGAIGMNAPFTAGSETNA